MRSAKSSPMASAALVAYMAILMTALKDIFTRAGTTATSRRRQHFGSERGAQYAGFWPHRPYPRPPFVRDVKTPCFRALCEPYTLPQLISETGQTAAPVKKKAISAARITFPMVEAR
jgi:hypothetical protein